MASNADTRDLAPESTQQARSLDKEDTRKTGATLKDIALAVDHLRVQFSDLSKEVTKVAGQIEGLSEHHADWGEITARLDQQDERIRRLEAIIVP